MSTASDTTITSGLANVARNNWEILYPLYSYLLLLNKMKTALAKDLAYSIGKIGIAKMMANMQYIIIMMQY